MKAGGALIPAVARAWLRRVPGSKIAAVPSRARSIETSTAGPVGARLHETRVARRIHWLVGIGFYLSALIVFRDVLLGIPSILAGDAVLNGDELVPFFNPTSQLLDQAKGQFSPLTNGFEFRVRYSFLTTWLRHHLVLPFAVLLVIPTIFWAVYLTVSKFVTNVFKTLSPISVALSAALPTTLIYMIVTYAKVTHFYTLILGLALMTMAVLLMLHALLFAGERWVRYALVSCLLTLFNPAVHYLVLFAVFFAVAGVTLLAGELAGWIRRQGPQAIRGMPLVIVRVARSKRRNRLIRRMFRSWGSTMIGRGVVSGLLFVFVTLIPYALFVEYVALRGVGNLAATVPGDYYFIRDASVSWLHVLSWDLAGIMDKILFGDYLAKVPRYPNVIYSLVMLAPIAVPRVRRALLKRRAHRQLFGVIYATAAFAVWATIGYAEPQWFPTFHRSIASVTRVLYATETRVGDLTLDLASTTVQVLRFPHRFQLILFMLAPMVMTLGLAWSIDALHLRWMARRDAASDDVATRGRDSLVLRSAATLWIATSFFAPFFSNEPYRHVFGSGNFGHFMTPFPVGDLQQLKQELLGLPEGKTVVLPPTETSKLVTDENGVDHKFNDKFFIYYLDQPSFYYGLTGDANNKFEFFLILRGIYYQQDWWINPARDIGIRYLIVNKSIRDNKGVGAEYLPNVESFIGPALERQEELGFVELRFENDTYALYELTDRAPARRETLLIDSSWTEYLSLVFDRLDLSRCYDFEYLSNYESGTESGKITLFTQDPESAAVDLYAVKHEDSFFSPSSKVFAFNSDIVSSNYYLSPMFRLFLFFSDTKWNRTEMITPGLFGTLRGSFVALPRPTRLTIPVSLAQPGEYRLLLRGAATANRLSLAAPSLDYEQSMEIRSPSDSLQYYTEESVYSEARVPIDTTRLGLGQLEGRIGAGMVPVNLNYFYRDLGTVHASPGPHVFTFNKLDDNPMLVEGLVLIPEDEFQQLAIPSTSSIVSDPNDLRCGSRYPVLDTADVNYVDPAANAEHRNLSNEELITLAAAGVSGLEPDEDGGFRFDWIALALTTCLLAAATKTVRSRTRPRPDEMPQTAQIDSAMTRDIPKEEDIADEL